MSPNLLPSRFPRLHRRGLIEAVVAAAEGAWTPHFRAFTGAVSLKPGSRSTRREGPVDFRAFTGAVSLKHVVVVAVIALQSNFRAFTGAVSLKRHVHGNLRVLAGVFPRLHRRGLIEAARAHSSTPHSPSFPRLHRRGLIEASMTSRIHGVDSMHFRAFTGAVSLKLLFLDNTKQP